MFFSIIVPLYNRPQEIDEMLDSLTKQHYSNFEVIVIEDGSTIPAKEIVEGYKGRLDVHYYSKQNQGQGFARNDGFARAKGDWFIVFDSDIIVPSEYLQHVARGINNQNIDAFGGPDAAHESFSATQKAISYSMTSPFTTGGIRGNKAHIGAFHPRSFNMGISRAVYEQTGGFRFSRRSEDIEFSIRMIEQGFRVELIADAFVYHKRRSTFGQFFRQAQSFGKGRIDIYKVFPNELKWVHALPAFFVIGLVLLLVCLALHLACEGEHALFSFLSCLGGSLLLLYTVLLFLHALGKTKRIKIAGLSVAAAYIQLCAYGLGFIENYVEKVVLKN
ncbi:glycosyltransferase [Sphingobacterium sp. JB170]|uniref:glycosyltransferase n=1 Tax=Sphingobacterium sp. JB170 TaxID=1434842 RepID=UPI00097E8D15|nr:glycosyltransferase [Sphingobacterium sp. JB170]SJN45292.1 Glycosyltransferase [Sphingobacterium sp. JB170]